MELGIVVDDISSMILAAWMAKKLGDWLKKVLPSYLQMIFNPLITVLVVSTITLVVTGPIIQGVANGIADFIDIVGEIPVVLTTGGIALTCKLVRACFFTLASSLVFH